MDKDILKTSLSVCRELEALLEMAVGGEGVPENIDALLTGKYAMLGSVMEFSWIDPGSPSGLRTVRRRARREERREVNEIEGKCEERRNNRIEEKPEERESALREVPAKDIRRLFSVNDKFRFRRELFGGSGEDFEDSLHLAAAMRSYAEAEDYFYNDLQWDPESQDVADFMEKIARYMES